MRGGAGRGGGGRADLCKDAGHAEVVARRAFRRALHDDPDTYDIARSGECWLFATAPPCGDAAIYELDDSTIAFSGAKLGDWRREDAQVTGAVRLKPGRSDTRAAERRRAQQAVSQCAADHALRNWNSSGGGNSTTRRPAGSQRPMEMRNRYSWWPEKPMTAGLPATGYASKTWVNTSEPHPQRAYSEPPTTPV